MSGPINVYLAPFPDVAGIVARWIGAVTGYRPPLPNAPWLIHTNMPSYRTEPVPGAVLGGTERNPEDDVIDAIDELVEWQLENGKGR